MRCDIFGPMCVTAVEGDVCLPPRSFLEHKQTPWGPHRLAQSGREPAHQPTRLAQLTRSPSLS